MTSIGQSFGDPGQQPDESVTRDATVNLHANVDDYSAQMAAASRQTNQLGQAVDNLTSKVDNLSKRAGRKLELFGGGIFAGLAGDVADAALLDKQLGTLRAGAAVTGTSLKGLKGDVDSAFTSFPIARGEAVALTGAISNLGVTGAREIGALDRVFIKLGASTGESMTGLATDLIQLSRLMGNTNTTQIGNFANAVLTVSKTAGVSASGVLQFSQSIAPIAREAGIGEAAVLGISAAFSKAGADGFVAANVFNSIVNDITNLTRTGSPELAKYANFIGLTVKQFEKLPGQEQVTRIFAAVAKGGPQALAFANELGLGTRGLSALQAVAQSGGLQKQIAIATGASHDQKNLNKGANAAFNDLGDSLARVRNQLTEMGDEIGGPVLTPLTKLGDAFANGLHYVGGFVKALGPVAPLLGLMAGALSVVAGLALGHAALIGTYALGKTVLGSAGRQTFRQGRDLGRAGQPLGDTAGMPLRTRLPYLAGGFYGRNTTGPTPGDEPGRLRQAGMFVARAPMRLATWAANSQSTSLRDSRLPGLQRSFYQNSAGEGQTMRQRFSSLVEENKATMAAGGAMRALTMDSAALGKAMVQLTGETMRSGLGMAGSAAGLGARAAGAGAARAFGAVRSGVGAVANAAFSLPGLLALSLGAPALSKLGGAIGHADNAGFDVNGSFNAITKYDNLLNQSSTNLADFSKAVTDASDKLGAIPTAGKSLPAVGQVGSADIAASSGAYKVTDTNLKTLTAQKGNAAAVAYLQTLGVQHGGMDAKTLQAVKQDLIATAGPQRAQSILNDYLKTSPGSLDQRVNYSALGKLANRYNGGSIGLGQFKGVVGQALSGAQSQAALAPGRASNRAELKTVLSVLGNSLQGTTYATAGDQVKAARAYLAQVFGGSPKDYNGVLPDRSVSNLQDPQYKQIYGSAHSLQTRILGGITATSTGRSFLKSAGVGIGPGTPASLNAALGGLSGARFPGLAASPQDQQLRSNGILGSFAAGSGVVQSAIGSKSGDPRVVQAAIEALTRKAVSSNGDFTDASEALMQLSDSMGGASTTTGALIASAAAWARQLQSFRVPYLSRGGQLGASLATVQSSYGAAHAPNASQASVDQYKQDRTAFEQQKAGYQQYLISVLQQAKQYGVQMVRAQEDQDKQIFRSERDFQIQMLQSQQDYNRQTFRTQRDHNVQMQQQAQTTAQTIYNPFLRVQSQYTADAGTTEQNLLDQNTRLHRQKHELDQLKAAGLSMEAIQTLDLANPNNAQQLDRLFQDLIHNPDAIGQLNAGSATRLNLTKSLTQSDFNLSYAQTQQNFSQGIKDAATDYNTARDRAVKAQHIALGDMATDYNTMVSRSAQDLQTSMTEIYGGFGNVFGRTMDLVTRDIGKYAPDAASMIEKSLRSIKAKYPELWDPHFTGASRSPVITGLAPGRKHGGAYADGGISIGPQFAMISEWSPNAAEAHIPIGTPAGEQMLSGMYQSIARSVVMQMHTSGHPAIPHGTGATSQTFDYSTEYSGPITVTASDTKTLERQLAAKARLKRLTSPARH